MNLLALLTAFLLSTSAATASAESGALLSAVESRILPCSGRIVQTLHHLSLNGTQPFLARLALSRWETFYHNLARRAAIAEARRAYQRVPAYAEFVGEASAIKSFEQLPVTSKSNYVLPALQRDGLSLYTDRAIPLGSIRDTSTGTSGIPTPWYRGPEETHHARQLMALRSSIVLNNQPYFFINAFALGPWATGITIALGVGADQKATLANIGPNPAEILKAVREVTRLFPGKTIVIAGYPPHMQELVELANAESFPLDQHPIVAVVGGESMSETQRDLILLKQGEREVIRTGFKQVYSFYGASDLDINIGFETDFEVALRRAALRDPKLASELFGPHPFVPMIFHYDPMANYIEVGEEGKLVITNVVGDRISPRIRYELGDRGAIMPMSQVLTLLESSGVNLGVRPNTNLPLVFIWGRLDSQIIYRGANLSPENLDEAIQLAGLGASVRNYGFRQIEEDGQTVTEILLELPDGLVAPNRVLAQLLANLRTLNVDFDKQIGAAPLTAYPRLRVFDSDSPMSRHRAENPSRKRKYIFLGSETANIQAYENGGKLVLFESTN